MLQDNTERNFLITLSLLMNFTNDKITECFEVQCHVVAYLVLLTPISFVYYLPVCSVTASKILCFLQDINFE